MMMRWWYDDDNNKPWRQLFNVVGNLYVKATKALFLLWFTASRQGRHEFWISQRYEMLLRKLWHLCAVALCLDENLNYVSPTIGTDAAGSQHTGIMQRTSTPFLHTCFLSVWLYRAGNTHCHLIRQPAGSRSKPRSMAWKSNELLLDHHKPHGSINFSFP